MAVPSVPAGDAYLDWGLATDFEHFESVASDVGGAQRRVGLLVRWVDAAAAGTGGRLAEACDVVVPAVYRRKSVLTWALRVPQARLLEFLDLAGPYLARAELASPVSSDGGRGDQAVAAGGAPTPAPAGADKGTSAVLAIVLDDGCAFAHPLLRRADRSSRLLWLWNQDADATRGRDLTEGQGPSADCSFRYGTQFSRRDLDGLIAQSGDRPGLAYALSGLPGLDRTAVHGMGVLDLLCTGLPDPDVVFVQFSRDAVDDPSGRWLPLAVLDGLHYALEAVGDHTRKVVACISWGPQTGPHDGSALLELAMDELLHLTRRENLSFEICLPAGNSFDAQAHAEIDLADGGPVQWVVPPSGDTPAFVEVWWPGHVAPQDARLHVTPPGGAEVAIRPGAELHDGRTWFSQVKRVGNSTMALLVVHPTSGADGRARGPHGAWGLRLAPLEPQQAAALEAGIDRAVHVYVARADHNMGARRRAKASRLTDAALQRARFRPPEDRHEEAPGSAVRRAGTLSGIATGARTRVAAGHRADGSGSASYSSSGPTRGRRSAPDLSCVTDATELRTGLRVAGVRDGATVRLAGTSAAAPQLAQWLAVAPNPSLPMPGQPNAPDPDPRQGHWLLLPPPGRARRRG